MIKEETKEKIKKKIKSGITGLYYMMMGIIIFLLVLSVYDGNFNLKKYLSNTVTKAVYNTYAISGDDDNFTNDIVKFCGRFDYSVQPRCVINQVKDFYNYTDHLGVILTPDIFVKKGGVCRDIAVTYAIIFRKLGWEADYEFPTPNHVLVRINKYWYCGNSTCFVNCDIDGVFKTCEMIGE